MEYMKCAIFREAFEHRKKPIAINVRIIWELEIYERKHGAAMRWLHRSPLIIVIIAWNYHSLWLAIRSHQLISFAPIKSRANTELHLYSHTVHWINQRINWKFIFGIACIGSDAMRRTERNRLIVWKELNSLSCGNGYVHGKSMSQK